MLATEPGGAADANGNGPGDVLHMVGGQKVTTPIDVDEIVYYWIPEGITDFDLGVYRDGGYVEVITSITEETYWEVIEVTTIESWSRWEVETSFSYEEYYAEYSEQIVETYESTETTLEETVTSEEFSEEMSEEVTEEVTEEEVFEQSVAEEEMTEDAYEDASDEEMEEDLAEDDVAEEGADEDVALDEGF